MTAVAENAETRPTPRGAGRVARVIGPVVDVEFPVDTMPEIYNALNVDVTPDAARTKTLTLEVAQHLGDSLVRAISMQPTDGLVRGAEVHRHRQPDHRARSATSPRATCSTPSASRWTSTESELDIKERWAIHRTPPAFDQLESKTEMFETGIKVIDLLTPYVQRRQDRPVRRCRRRQDRAHPGDDLPRRRELRWCLGVRRRRRAHP